MYSIYNFTSLGTILSTSAEIWCTLTLPATRTFFGSGVALWQNLWPRLSNHLDHLAIITSHSMCVFSQQLKKVEIQKLSHNFFHYIWGNTNSTLEFKPRHLGCRWGLLLFHEPPVPWAWLRGFNFILKFDCHKNTSTQKSNYAASPYF